jgi:hypothetical protein
MKCKMKILDKAKLNSCEMSTPRRAGMPICVECGAPATDVYKEYGGKGTGNIRLTRCVRTPWPAAHYLFVYFISLFIIYKIFTKKTGISTQQFLEY